MTDPVLIPLTPGHAEELWQAVRAYGENIWADGEWSVDGRAAWRPIKTAVERAKGEGAWAAETAATDFVSLLADLEVYELDSDDGCSESSDDDGPTREDAHCYAQLFRIPRREECSLRRILQIAYNVGQLGGSGALRRWTARDQKWADLYDHKKLDRLATYCTDFGTIQVPEDLLAAVRAGTEPKPAGWRRCVIA